MQRMLQALLADPFRLTVRQETKELPLYALVVARNGPKLQAAKEEESAPDSLKDSSGSGRSHRSHIQKSRGQLAVQGASMVSLAQSVAGAWPHGAG